MKKMFMVLAIMILGLCFAGTAMAQGMGLTWNANTEPDLVGYIVYYTDEEPPINPVAADFEYHKNVINVTEVDFVLIGADDTADKIPIAQDGQRYWFAVTAYNATAGQSGLSNVVNTLRPAAYVPPTDVLPTDGGSIPGDTGGLILIP